MKDSIFTKIIKGEIPCYKVFEDDQTIAFLDINPLEPGHTLVVPKVQIDHLWDLGDPLYHHLMDVVKLVAQRQQAVLQPKRVGMALMGFEVPHAHVHVVPLNKGFIKTTVEFADREKKEADKADLAIMAKRLAF